MALGGDRRSLRLREEDEELITRVSTVQSRTVVLMMGGSAIVVEPWIESVAAALHVWYPGMEGGRAIADVLTGATNPCGRLPFAVPTDENHLAHFDPDATQIRYDAWHGQWLLDRDGHEARFPFGFGLSFTQFLLKDARYDGSDIVVTIDNTGNTGGAAVVFAFRSTDSTQRLVGFRKVRIAAGSSRTVRIPAGSVGRVRIALHAHDPEAIDLDSGMDAAKGSR